VTAKVIDEDAAGVVITQTGDSTDLIEGAEEPTYGAVDTYEVVLTRQPTDNVYVTITPDFQVRVAELGDPLSASPIMLTFTAGDWNSPRTIVVAAFDDDVREGFHHGYITHSATSADVDLTEFATDLDVSTDPRTSVLLTHKPLVITGAATAGTTNTLVDSEASFPTGGQSLTDFIVKITSGTGEGQTRIVASNTGTELTVTSGWTTIPDATSRYEIITPVSVSVTVGSDTQVRDPDRYRVISSTILFVDADGRPEMVEGDVEVTYYHLVPGYDGLDVDRVSTNIGDSDTPGVLVTESNGSTNVIERDVEHLIGQLTGNSSSTIVTGDFGTLNLSGSTIVITDGTGAGQSRLIESNTSGQLTVYTAWDPVPDDTSTYAIIPFVDTYTVVLTSPPSSEVTVHVTPRDTRTTRGKLVTYTEQVEVSADTLTFTTDNWDVPQTVIVWAIDDWLADGGDTKAFAPMLHTVNDIQGPLFVDGAGGQGSLEGLGEPVMLPGYPADPADIAVEDDISVTGAKVLFSGTPTSAVNDPDPALTDSAAEFPTYDNGLIGLLVKVKNGGGDVQLRRIVDNTETQITVSVDWTTVPDGTWTYEIIDESPDETNKKPSTGDVIDATTEGKLTVLTADVVLYGSLIDRTVEITAGPATGQFRLIWHTTEDTVEIDGLPTDVTILWLNEPLELEEDETLEEIREYAITNESLNFFVDEDEQVDFMTVFHEDSMADNNDDVFNLAGHLTEATEDSKEDGYEMRITGLGMGPDTVIGGTAQPGGITYGRLEVVEINLGHGDDAFVVDATHRRDDFQTWTILNTGDGNDDVTISLSDQEQVLHDGTATTATAATLEDSSAAFPITGSGLAGYIVRITAGTGEGQTRRITSNTETKLTLLSPWETIPDDSSEYQVVDEADGPFAVNTQGGNDSVDGSASTLPLVIFGGDGDDQDLIGGSGDDIIFGDRGRVDYLDEDGKVVTRLGDGPEPEDAEYQPTGQLRQPFMGYVDDWSETSLTDDEASFPVPDYPVETGLVGLVLWINDGTGRGQSRLIVDNTETRLDIDPETPWSIEPDTTSRYYLTGIPADQTDGVFRGPRLILSIDPDVGGDDIITGNGGNDIILGGCADDTIDGNTGDDIIFGDNGRIDLEPDPAVLGGYGEDGPQMGDEVPTIIDLIQTIHPSLGGEDTIQGNEGYDIILGGANGDTISGNTDNDVILGDNGLLDFTFEADTDLSTLDLIQTTNTNFGGSDTIYGNDDDDIILGGTAGDVIYGNENDDFVLGDFGKITLVDNVTKLVETTDYNAGAGDIIFGGSDEDVLVGGDGGDVIDGGTEDDLIFGDNVRLDRRGDIFNDYTSPRFRALLGTLIYDGDDNDLVDDAQDYEDPTGVPVWANWDIFINDTAGFDYYGDDYIAGGAQDDTIFGQMGNDTIQGDGAVTVTAEEPDAPSFVIPGFFVDDTPVVFDLFEAATDGDDYIEGNGGDDHIYGGLGQDDILGGSSDLFSLLDTDNPVHDRKLRQDGSDTIFGGAGVRVLRNDMLTEDNYGDIILGERHARDADMILGDNGDIFRLVGTNSTNQGQFLTFNYDDSDYDGYDETLKIIPRAARLLDYSPGGPDYEPNDGIVDNDIGAADELHGETGDDFIYGMVGDDILFGEAEDDDIIGGYGNDWVSGGTGGDGILGDDGRIYTSRNVEKMNNNDTDLSEPLYGIEKLDEVDKRIDTPGDIQWSIINVNGQLKKTVNLTPFKLGDPDEPQYSPTYDPAHADDIIYGGWGNDFIHAGDGDDAVSGAEALLVFYANPVNPGDVLAFDAGRGEFADYDEYYPRTKIPGFLLNFDADDWFIDDYGQYQLLDEHSAGTEFDPVMTDGDDVIFGDLGNDWLVGGTGRDHIYGGRGSDLLNADDDHDTNGGLNDAPDTHPSYEDIAYGGAGRDVIIGNTGGDRLIDWVGEFNSYIVPYAPAGRCSLS
jgi:Ca2+-binding RTX toxin-like protein